MNGIVLIPTAHLQDNPHNANRHSEAQIAKLAGSLSRFGFICPVIIDERGQIFAGHGRVAAARKLGLEEVPVIRVTHLSEKQKRAFMIADNRIAEESRWDQKQLAQEFEAILAMDGDLEIVETGFELAEIDVLIEKQKDPPAADVADCPIDLNSVEQVCRRGDLWLMGQHKLFCGDALDPASYQVLLGGERAQMIFSDPPYNVSIEDHASGLGKAKRREFAMASGEMTSAQFEQFLMASCTRMAEVAADGAMIFLCMDWRSIATLIATGGRAFNELKALCVWDKGRGGMGSLYRSQHELAVFKSGKGKHINNVALGRHGRNRSNVWTYPGMNSFGHKRDEKLAWHPTVKNLAMVGDAILDCSLPGGLILDPFGGSGTTAIAAERTRRRAALIELDPVYCGVILQRYANVTGTAPVNMATGDIVMPRQSLRSAD